MPGFFSFLLGLHIVISMLLVLVVLLQSGKGGGLASGHGPAMKSRVFACRRAGQAVGPQAGAGLHQAEPCKFLGSRFRFGFEEALNTGRA